MNIKKLKINFQAGLPFRSLSFLRAKEGEITTIIALGTMAFILLTTVASTFISKRPQTTSTKASTGCIFTALNLCQDEIASECGSSAKGTCTSSDCLTGKYKIVCSSSPTATKIPSAKPTGSSGLPRCTAGSYMEPISNCEKYCGVGQCKACDQGGIEKFECKNSTLPTGKVPKCSQARTYASDTNCKAEGCSEKCSQCQMEGAIRYECGGSGPVQCESGKTSCGQECCSSNQNCIKDICENPVTNTPKPIKTQTPTSGANLTTTGSITPTPTKTPTPTPTTSSTSSCSNLGSAKQCLIYCNQGGNNNLYYSQVQVANTTAKIGSKTVYYDNNCNRITTTLDTYCGCGSGLETVKNCVNSAATCHKGTVGACGLGYGLVFDGTYCYAYFSGVWSKGQCCVPKPTSQPLPTKTLTDSCASYTCQDACEYEKYYSSKRPDKIVYRSGYNYWSTKSDCYWKSFVITSVCGCTNKTSLTQGFVSNDTIIEVTDSDENCNGVADVGAICIK